MKTLRCAIYTRKSTEDGLEQDFNSLHAQREACEAYIKSQASEGWQCLTTQYDDGGFSGGNMTRPGLQALLAHVEAGAIDIVVVYKVDRLTRSLTDFSRIVEKLDTRGVSFVSVTQSFNTTTSMGRLTLNVLLSFAQFEREVTTERIRDKVAASKKKGIWMGGPVPLGYNLKNRKLYINQVEAQTVRWLYNNYLETGSVRALKENADRKGFRSKCYIQQSGRQVGGHPFSRGQLYCLLRNPLYRGQIRHRDKIYDGLQEAIIDESTWGKVQSLLSSGRSKRQVTHNNPSGGWLARILIDSNGEPMVTTHATRAGRKYRYYVSASLMTKRPDKNTGWRLPADQIERIVTRAITAALNDPVMLLNILGIQNISVDVMTSTANITAEFIRKITSEDKSLIRPLLHQVRVSLHEIAIDMDITALAHAVGIDLSKSTGDRNAAIHNGCSTGDCKDSPTIPINNTADNINNVHPLTIPVQLKRRGVELKIITPGLEQDTVLVDEALITLVARAHVWFEQVKAGTPVKDIARAAHLHLADVSRILPLAFLAPDIVTAILDGNHPADLTAVKLKRLSPLPHYWSEQRHHLGFPPV